MEELTWQAAAFLILGLIGMGAAVAILRIKAASMFLRLKEDLRGGKK